MTGFAKVFASMLDSTIWREPDHVRLVWITMLCMADKYGKVHASIPGLADRARVDISKCEDALDRLMSPDKYSRTKDADGRRIDEIDGGWVLINFQKYRSLLSEERKAEQNRNRQRRWRERNANSNASNANNAVVTRNNDIADPEADTDPEAEKDDIYTSNSKFNRQHIEVELDKDHKSTPLALKILIYWPDYPVEQAAVTAAKLYTDARFQNLDLLATCDAAFTAWPSGRSLYDRNGLHGYLAAFFSNAARDAQRDTKPRRTPAEEHRDRNLAVLDRARERLEGTQ